MPITLLPSIGFYKSLKTMDDARVNKQRQDVLTILRALMGDGPHHISQDGWTGFEFALGVFGMTACSVWQNQRGHRDNLSFQIHEILEGVPHELDMPPWVGDLNLHRSHRSYLVRKNSDYYAAQFPNNPENMPIFWPQIVDSDPRGYRLRLSAMEERALLAGERTLPEWLRYDKNKREIIDLEDS
jgi:hypothetical protein